MEILGFKSGTELSDLIRNSLGVVVPSLWYEPLPTTVLEAFAYGRPVIGSAIGGIPELINDREDGLIFPAGEQQALREHILWLIEHPQRAAEMGQSGRKKIETMFTPERYYQELMTVYQHVLG